MSERNAIAEFEKMGYSYNKMANVFFVESGDSLMLTDPDY